MVNMAASQTANAFETAENEATARKTALAGYVGGTLEYYDLYIYASAAALVFGKVFFPEAGASAALLSVSTFGVAYIARPLGAIVFGTLADRVGRKDALVYILLMMGAATFLIGCLPSYAQAGIWAPALLVVLRLLQGMSAGGETASASTLIVEVAPAHKRGFYTSWVSNGIVSGFVLAYLSFLPIAMLPEDQLLSWGWRIPFWASAIVMLVGLQIRRKLHETESFEEARASGALAKVPLVELLQTHRSAVLRVILCTLALSINTAVAIFGLSYATGVAGIPRDTMLLITILTNAAALVTQPLCGMLADRIGHRIVFAGGTLVSAALVFTFFAAIEHGNIVLIALSNFLIISVFYAAVNAIYPAFFAEQFSLRVRSSGMAISQQIGQIAAGFAPALGTLLVGADKTNWVSFASVVAIFCVVGAISALTARETTGLPQHELGIDGAR